MKKGLSPYLLFAYVLTIPFSIIAGRFESSFDLMAYLRIACLLSLAVHVFALLRIPGVASRTRGVLAIAAGSTWAALLTMEIYRVVTLIPFTFSFAVSSLADTARTLDLVLGRYGTGYAIATLLVLVCSASLAADRILRALERLRLSTVSPMMSIGCIASLAIFVLTDARYVVEQAAIIGRAQFNKRPLRSPDYSALQVASNDSVFQLGDALRAYRR